VVHRSPRLFGLEQSRWTLAGLRHVCVWLWRLSLVGVHGVLQRLGIHYKRGRRYVHSPDPAYNEKLAAIAAARAAAAAQPTRVVFLYQDELTYYRRPSVAQGYALVGSDGPHADQGHGTNKKRRIAGCLNVLTGALCAWQRASFDRHTLIRFYRAVEAAYPAAAVIYLAQDNWPVQAHPGVVLTDLRAMDQPDREGVAQAVSRTVALARPERSVDRAGGAGASVARCVHGRLARLAALRRLRLVNSTVGVGVRVIGHGGATYPI
jgi:hypothetical protein